MYFWEIASEFRIFAWALIYPSSLQCYTESHVFRSLNRFLKIRFWFSHELPDLRKYDSPLIAKWPRKTSSIRHCGLRGHTANVRNVL